MEQQFNKLQSSSVLFQAHVFETADRLEHLIFRRSDAIPSATSVTKAPMSDLNGRSYNVQVTEVSSVDNKVQQMLISPRAFVLFQVGMELAQVLFTNELASSTLTSRRINSQLSMSFDPAKL